MAAFLEGMYNESTDQDPNNGAGQATLEFLDDVMATGWDCYLNPRPGRDPRSMDFEPGFKRTDEEHAAAMCALKPPALLMARLIKREERRAKKRERPRGGVRVLLVWTLGRSRRVRGLISCCQNLMILVGEESEVNRRSFLSRWIQHVKDAKLSVGHSCDEGLSMFYFSLFV